jgi:hypothetical protein
MGRQDSNLGPTDYESSPKLSSRESPETIPPVVAAFAPPVAQPDLEGSRGLWFTAVLTESPRRSISLPGAGRLVALLGDRGLCPLREQEVCRHLALALDDDSPALLGTKPSSSRRYVRSVTWIVPVGA